MEYRQSKNCLLLETRAEVRAWLSVDTWSSSNLIGQNYLGWQAKQLARRYQTTLSKAILVAGMVGWERGYMYTRNLYTACTNTHIT